LTLTDRNFNFGLTHFDFDTFVSFSETSSITLSTISIARDVGTSERNSKDNRRSSSNSQSNHSRLTMKPHAKVPKKKKAADTTPISANDDNKEKNGKKRTQSKAKLTESEKFSTKSCETGRAHKCSLLSNGDW
jgi:hypothetical protein